MVAYRPLGPGVYGGMYRCIHTIPWHGSGTSNYALSVLVVVIWLLMMGCAFLGYVLP